MNTNLLRPGRVPTAQITPQSCERKYKCKTCGEVFSHGQALGGHMSRTHPGMSSAFNKKVERRKERAVDRELLRLAKEKHAKMFGEEKKLDRVKIRRFKKEFRKSVVRGELVL